MKANVKSLNIKNMKETLINYSGMQSVLDKIWDSFYLMACVGFISDETWDKFSRQCGGWYIDEELCAVRDIRNGNAVVWVYNPESVYRA